MPSRGFENNSTTIEISQNPYYDGELELDPRSLNSMTNQSAVHYSENVVVTQNPYYEGDFELSTMSNEQSRKNTIHPDLNDTAIVTATQNVYYEL